MLAGSPEPALERAIFGTDEPTRIARQLEDFASEHLSARVAGSLFYGTSVGCTFGLLLADGRRVVVKARPPVSANSGFTLGARTLRQVSSVMSFLAVRGYPCPRLLLEPRPLGLGLATVEAYTERLFPRPHSPLFDFEKSAAGAAWDDWVGVLSRAGDVLLALAG